MSIKTNKGPIIDPGMCRCCGTVKKCRLLNAEYEWCGQKEIYSDMFLDCFGLVLSSLDGEAEERLICATCVVRLRDAIQFRCQVLKCEETLLKSKINADTNELKPKQELDIKEETADDDNNDSCHEECIDDITDCCDEDIRNEPLNILKQKTLRDKTPRNNLKLKNKEDIQAKAELLEKIKRLKDRVIILKRSDKTTDIPLVKLVKKKKYVDTEYNALQNAITIIENSYICPFLTIYSDYYCIYCKEMFIEPDALREHTYTHDPGTYRDVIDNKKVLLADINRIECRLCRTKLDNVDDLKRHLANTHGKAIHAEAGNEFLKFVLRNGKMSCTQCDKPFSFFQALRKHMAEHFGSWVCDVCGAHYFEERHLVFHKKQAHKSDGDEAKVYVCVECGKSFKSKKGRYFHVAKIHNNEPAYPCNKCDQIFLSYHLRYKHKMEEHGELRSFPCESCDKVYNSRKSLREHTRKNHLLLLKHECGHCDKKFYLPSQLKDHMTSHTGERNFRCEFCGKCYPRLKALKVHMESHSTEKKYKCSLCSAAYTQLNNYKNHMKSKHQDVGEQFF